MPQAKIIIRSRHLPHPIQHILTQEHEVQIGRSPACQITINDIRLSRVHCRLFFDPVRTCYCVEDLKSVNGTYLNHSGQRIRPNKPIQLVHKDIIKFGDSKLYFEIEMTIQLPPKNIPMKIGKINNYEVIRLLGTGGIGDVYLVSDPTSREQQFALKLIKASVAMDKDMVQRFYTEASAYVQLQEHPTLPKIYDYGIYDDRPYLVLEYVTGISLSDFIYNSPEHRLTPITSLIIAEHIASALIYAHSRNIIHRDIKPSNILIATNPNTQEISQVKLIDLGLAKLLDRHGITVPGTTLGTPRYMPREQIENIGGVSFLVDIYSLGATIYSMLSGVPPYSDLQTPQLTELLKYIIKYDPVPIQNLVPNLPQSVNELVNKAMARRAQDRYQSAEKLHDAIVKTLQTLMG